MKALTAPFQKDKLEFIKNPIVAEFLGLSPNLDFTETVAQSDQGGGQIFEMPKWHLKHQRR